MPKGPSKRRVPVAAPYVSSSPPLRPPSPGNRIALALAALGLLTAILAFGEKALSFFELSSLPSGAAQHADESRSPEHVVVHQSGTEHMLAESDDLIITDELVTRDHGSYDHQLNAQLDIKDADGRMSYTAKERFCANHSYRILNNTSSTVVIEFGFLELDGTRKIGIGPGERWASEPLQDGQYRLQDASGHWLQVFEVLPKNGPKACVKLSPFD